MTQKPLETFYFNSKNAYTKTEKSSCTFNIFPAVQLDQTKTNYFSLLEFSMYNSIPNIDSTNNVFKYTYNAVPFVFEIEKGLYGINDLISSISQNTLENTGKDDLFDFYPDRSTGFLWVRFPYVGTSIDFTVPNSVSSILGFPNSIIITSGVNDWVKGVVQSKLNTADSLRLHCDVVYGSCVDGISNSDVIAIVNLVANTGSRNLTIPNTLMPAKINTTHINKITFTLTDELNHEVNYFNTNEDYDIQIQLSSY